MPDIASWIINNVKEARAGDGLTAGIIFAIWQRQWEICDIIGDRTRARDIARKASALAEGEPFYTLATRRYRAQLLIYGGEYKKALEVSEESLSLASNFTDASLLAEIYGQISQTNHSLSNFEQAVVYSQKAGDIYRTAGENEKLGNNLASRGLIYWRMGQFPKALDILKQAAGEFGIKSNDRFVAAVLTNTANVLLALDRVDQAMEHYQRALEISRRIGDVAKQSALSNNIGSIMLRQGDYSGALENFQRGLKLDRMLGNLTGQATKLGNMAVLQASIGNQDEAMANFEKALEIDRTTGNQDGQVRKLVNVSSLYGMKGDYSKALACIDEALEICRKINSRSYLGFSLAQKVEYLGQLGRHEEAKALAGEAIEIGEEVGNLSQMVNLYSSVSAINLETGEAATALDYSTKAVNLVESHKLFEANLENCYYTQYRCLASLNKPEEAARSLEIAYREVQKKMEDLTDQKERAALISKNSTYAGIVKKWKELNKP